LIDLARLPRRYALHPSSNPRSTAAESGTVVRLSTARAFSSLQDANAFDLYKILGISRRASPLEIKVAFRKLAKTLHPDGNRGDRIAEKQFADLHEAYTILGNAELRAIYDREFARICGEPETELATQDGGSVARRRRHIWHEVAKTAAATVVLTACFSIGISLWQQSSSGRIHTAASVTGPLQPPSISREELASALFGSQASLYADAPTAPSEEKVAANGSTAANPATPTSKAVATSSKPAVAGGEAMAASIEAVASGNETVVSNVPAAVIEPPPVPLAASAEVAIAVEASPPTNQATAPSAPSKRPDQARAQAERLAGLGERHLADGNIAIARQFFARAFDLGLAPAAIRLAETFEPQLLARLGAHGLKPDPAEAEKWRRRALELGQ
jgi:curved DNA-binding protein CbpA